MSDERARRYQMALADLDAALLALAKAQRQAAEARKLVHQLAIGEEWMRDEWARRPPMSDPLRDSDSQNPGHVRRTGAAGGG